MASEMYRIYCLALFYISSYLLSNTVEAVHVNITKLENCDDHVEMGRSDEHMVLITSVEYDRSNGYCDTLSGTYAIRAVNTDKLEVDIKMFKCPLDSDGVCGENGLEFFEHLGCERFTQDSSGPWYMISSAMEDGRCGEKKGEFKLTNAQMKLEYLDKYIHDITEDSRHRLRMIFYKINPAQRRLRGCLDIDFYVLNV